MIKCGNLSSYLKFPSIISGAFILALSSSGCNYSCEFSKAAHNFLQGANDTLSNATTEAQLQEWCRQDSTRHWYTTAQGLSGDAIEFGRVFENTENFLQQNGNTPLDHEALSSLERETVDDNLDISGTLSPNQIIELRKYLHSRLPIYALHSQLSRFGSTIRSFCQEVSQVSAPQARSAESTDRLRSIRDQIARQILGLQAALNSPTVKEAGRIACGEPGESSTPSSATPANATDRSANPAHESPAAPANPPEASGTATSGRAT